MRGTTAGGPLSFNSERWGAAVRQCLLEKEGGKRAGESGQDVLAVEGAVGRHDRLTSVLAIDPGQPALGIDYPHQPRAGGEPVGDPGENFAGAVAGRQRSEERRVGKECRS